MKPKFPDPSGDPLLFRCWYLSSVAPEQGFGLHLSLGCCSSTTIGTTYFACANPPARAFAWARTVTDSTPKTLAKKPGAGFVPSTLIVSLAMTWLEKVTVMEPPPFFTAYWFASAPASPVDSGSF